MMRRVYVDVPTGQLHLAIVGTGPPIVLLPWFPLSAEMYSSEFEAFHARGWQVIGIDPLGQGNSHTHARSITIEQHAESIAIALHTVGATSPVLVGGHMGSQMAAALAQMPDVNARALVLDGGPMVDPEVLQGLFAKMSRVDGLMIPEDGSVQADYVFQQAVNTYDIFAPGYEATPDTLPILYRFMRDFLNAYLPRGGAQLTADTPQGYDFEGALKRLTLSGVIITSETEPLASSFDPICRAFAGPMQTHIFPGDHPLHHPSRAGEFADAIDACLTKLNVRPV